MTINGLHQIIHYPSNSTFDLLLFNIWKVMGVVNGDVGNYGIRFMLIIFFALFLVILLQMRAKVHFDRIHFVAFVGVLLLLFRGMIMLGFDWGYQIGIYNDPIINLLSPPLEHFFNMMFFCCMAYYTLNIFHYYPGLLKKIIWGIPCVIFVFFIYATISWKHTFMGNLPYITLYKESVVYWQTHILISIIAVYSLLVGIFKYKKFNKHLVMFWLLVSIEHIYTSYSIAFGVGTPELNLIAQTISIWSLPVLILHFVNSYSLKQTIGNGCLRMDCPSKLLTGETNEQNLSIKITRWLLCCRRIIGY